MAYLLSFNGEPIGQSLGRESIRFVSQRMDIFLSLGQRTVNVNAESLAGSFCCVLPLVLLASWLFLLRLDSRGTDRGGHFTRRLVL